MFVSLINYCSSSSLFHCSFVVCRDGSCGGGGACFDANIDYVLGPSCTGTTSCFLAKIGSAYRSCLGPDSCLSATIGSAYNSCFSRDSCNDATIDSVDSSCLMRKSCYYLELSEADLINSCKKEKACNYADGEGLITKLDDCCNEDEQCEYKEGTDIYAYCVSYCLLCTYSVFDCLFVRRLTFSQL